MHETLLILGMMLVTFVPRYLPFALAGRVALHPVLRQALDFVPIAVLTALVTQSATYRGGALQLTPDNPYLIAAVVAFITALSSRRFLPSVIAGIAGYILAMWLL